MYCRFFPLLACFLASAFFITVSPSQAQQPHFGFVTVAGTLTGDDQGPDPRIIGHVIGNSDATIVRAGLDEARVFPALAGKIGIGYLEWADVPAIQEYNSLGYHHFIFGNEPDGTAFTNPNWAQDYMNRLNTAYPVIKATNPANVVIGGNLHTLNLDKLYQHGYKNSNDMVGYHNYSNDPATGNNIDVISLVRNQMNAAADGSKKIFLGEGWGPARELPGLKRSFPDARITPAELSMLRDFVVNGYWNLSTPKGNYDPAWVWGALFFTLNDNWGYKRWAERAVAHYDGQGNVLYYTIDGYYVGLDIFPRFFNGGLVDIWGNSKDALMDIFPGRGLALLNGGFEYWDPAASGRTGSFWTPRVSPAPAANYSIDGSVRRSGQFSQRLAINGTNVFETLTQDTVRASASPGQTYGASVWVKTHKLNRGTGFGAVINITFLNSSGAAVGNQAWSSGISGTTDWTLVTASASAPAGTDRIRVSFGVYGNSGTAWFDDVTVWRGASSAGTLSGYVLDTMRQPVAGALVQTTSGGYSATTGANGFFQINGVVPATYSIRASATGYTSQVVESQPVLPGKTRPLGFALAKDMASRPTGLRVTDPAVGGTLRLTWSNPSGPFDYVRVYRSEDAAQIGQVVHDGVTSDSLWDTGLVDGVKYRYTIQAVVGGQEVSNPEHAYGISSGGALVQAYNNYPGPQWGHWGANFGQTFVATVTGSLASASCTPGLGAPGSVLLTFRIRQGGPAGAYIGPARSVQAAGDNEATVFWSLGEVPVTQGQTYYVEVTGAAGFAPYRGPSNYNQGAFYINGSAAGNTDMWSTINIAQAYPVVITDAVATPLPGGARITWNTSALATSQVDWGTTDAYGNSSPVDSTLKGSHSVDILGIPAGQEIYFRVRSTRPGIPEAVTRDYTFIAGAAASVGSPALAKQMPEGTAVSLTGVVSASYPGVFYLQAEDRSSGIRVQLTTSATVPSNRLVTLIGNLGTNAEGERYILASSILGGAPMVAVPLGMNLRTLGGESTAGQQGMEDASGLSNIGLLVRISGVVTHSEQGFFYVDDGSGISDGSGYAGVRVLTMGAPAPSAGQVVTFAGPCSVFRVGNTLQRRVLLRSGSLLVH